MPRRAPTQTSLFPDMVELQKPKQIKSVLPPDVVTQAEELLQEWYLERTPHPHVANWAGARKIIARFMDDWPPQNIRQALRYCDGISTAWIENSLRKLYPPSLPTLEVVTAEVPDFARPSVDFGY